MGIAAVEVRNMAFLTRQYTILRDNGALSRVARENSETLADGRRIAVTSAVVQFWANAQGLLSNGAGLLAMPIRVRYYADLHNPPLEISHGDTTEEYGVFDGMQGEEFDTALRTVNDVLDRMKPLWQSVVLAPGEWPVDSDVSDSSSVRISPLLQD